MTTVESREKSQRREFHSEICVCFPCSMLVFVCRSVFCELGFFVVGPNLCLFWHAYKIEWDIPYFEQPIPPESIYICALRLYKKNSVCLTTSTTSSIYTMFSPFQTFYAHKRKGKIYRVQTPHTHKKSARHSNYLLRVNFLFLMHIYLDFYWIEMACALLLFTKVRSIFICGNRIRTDSLQRHW